VGARPRRPTGATPQAEARRPTQSAENRRTEPARAGPPEGPQRRREPSGQRGQPRHLNLQALPACPDSGHALPATLLGGLTNRSARHDSSPPASPCVSRSRRLFDLFVSRLGHRREHEALPPQTRRKEIREPSRLSLLLSRCGICIRDSFPDGGAFQRINASESEDSPTDGSGGNGSSRALRP
jgi:hypothetical protein